MILHIHRIHGWGFAAAAAMFIDTLIPAFAGDHLGWLRWRIPLIVFAAVSFICLVVLLFLLSRQEYEREQKDHERDLREQDRDGQLAKVVQYFEAQNGVIPSSPQEASKTTSDPRLQADDPRVYVALARSKKRFGDQVFLAPTSTFILRNEGEREARKVQIDSLILFKSRADFDTVECISAHGEARVLPRTSETFERSDIVRIMIADWDAKGEVTGEYSKPMRMTYKDYAGKSFQTTFDLVLLPIREIVFRRLPPNAEHYEETLFIRNIEVKPLE